MDEKYIPDDVINFELWMSQMIDEVSNKIVVLHSSKEFEYFRLQILRACNETFDTVDDLSDNVWLNITDPGDPEQDYEIDTLKVFAIEQNFDVEAFERETIKDDFAGAHILSDALYLRWDYHTKTFAFILTDHVCTSSSQV